MTHRPAVAERGALVGGTFGLGAGVVLVALFNGVDRVVAWREAHGD